MFPGKPPLVFWRKQKDPVLTKLLFREDGGLVYLWKSSQMQTTPHRQLTGGQCPVELICVGKLVDVGFLRVTDTWPFQPQRQNILLLGAE